MAGMAHDILLQYAIGSSGWINLTEGADQRDAASCEWQPDTRHNLWLRAVNTIGFGNISKQPTVATLSESTHYFNILYI